MVFKVVVFWGGMKAAGAALKQKGAFTLRRYRNALFGRSLLENRPEKRFGLVF